MDKEYNEGWEAAKEGKDIWSNPYSVAGDNSKFVSWNDGWRDYTYF